MWNKWLASGELYIRSRGTVRINRLLPRGTCSNLAPLSLLALGSAQNEKGATAQGTASARAGLFPALLR